MALMTPEAGFSQSGKVVMRSSKWAWWVIQGWVLMEPSSMRAMMREKSRERALREARMESSRRWMMGACGKEISCWEMPT